MTRYAVTNESKSRAAPTAKTRNRVSASPASSPVLPWDDQYRWPQTIRHLVAISAELAKTRPGADPGGRRTILCDNDPTFVLYRISQRFGLPVVPEWANWFHEELSRRGAIKPLIGLGCSPVLVSGTKKLFLKWIRTALRQKRIEVPECNGPVRWNSAQRFFRIDQSVQEEGIRQEFREETNVVTGRARDG